MLGTLSHMGPCPSARKAVAEIASQCADLHLALIVCWN